MTPLQKGLIVAVVHVLMVSSLGAKLLMDRATQPRVWARTAPIDPDHPLRGRYVRLRIEGRAEGVPGDNAPVRLDAREGALVFVPSETRTGLTARINVPREGGSVAVLNQPIAFFIPEHVPDPSIRGTGEELWVEVTLPRRGPPRPIRLAVKKNGMMTPLE